MQSAGLLRCNTALLIRAVSDPNDSQSFSSATEPKRFWAWVYGAGLMVALVGCYWPALNGGFVWDDDAWTSRLAHLFNSTGGLWRIWTDVTALQQYYPLTGTTFWLDHRLWGAWTLPYHIENLILHALAVLLFWRALAVLHVRGAWLAAGLFALHPMMAESVAWITERKNVLSQVLMLASLLCYLRFDPLQEERITARAWWAYALALLLFVAAVLAKVSVLVLPVLIVLLCWWKRGRVQWRRDLLPLVPFALVSLLMAVVVAWIERTALGAKGAEFDHSFAERLLIAGRSFWFYPLQMLWPVRLCFVYPQWALNAASLWQWSAPVAVAVVFAMFWRFRVKLGRGGIVVAVCYLTSVAPVLGMVSAYGMRYSFVWDHWFYLPCLSLFAGIGALAAKVSQRLGGERTLAIFAVVLLSALGVLTWSASSQYQNVETLWQRTLEGNPDCWLAYNNLSVLYFELKDPERALASAKKSLALNPNFLEAHITMGYLLNETGHSAEAEASLRASLKRWPNEPDLHHNLGVALEAMQQQDAALAEYKEVVRLQPRHALALSNIGRILLGAGAVPEALQFFNRAVDFKPDEVTGLNNLIWLLASTPDAALRDGKRAIALGEHAVEITKGKMPILLAALAAAYAEDGRFAEAKATGEKACALATELNQNGYLGIFQQQLESYMRGEPIRQQIK